MSSTQQLTTLADMNLTLLLPESSMTVRSRTYLIHLSRAIFLEEETRRVRVPAVEKKIFCLEHEKRDQTKEKIKAQKRRKRKYKTFEPGISLPPVSLKQSYQVVWQFDPSQRTFFSFYFFVSFL